jgi:hypothetical protein
MYSFRRLDNLPERRGIHMPPKKEIEEAPAPERRRDVRVDQIGFVNELMKRFADPLKDKVKADQADKVVLEGDFFEGAITSSTDTEISASGWFRLYESKVIDRAQFVDGLKVSTTVAKRVLDEKTLNRLSKQSPGPRKLTITRKKTVELGLVTAVRNLGDTIAAAAEAVAPELMKLAS